ncbi:GATOR complex protein depdc5 [Imshaugia aleurites]|uniref:Vacuolar membrane-associated protein IML1 n=1 Tax=Imshaugia aleurites TaxID=172621 RepID=A0A8H3FMN2_9LECA|nr:GATOR complex protein depdc5 [Imshaugia aleurites]
MAANDPSRPLRASHLRHMSTGSSTAFHGADGAAHADELMPRADVIPTAPNTNSETPVRLLCNLTIHDENVSKEDVLINLALFHGSDVKAGTLMQLTALKGSIETIDHGLKPQSALQKPTTAAHVQPENVDVNRHHVFSVKAIGEDMLLKQPNVQISISRRVEHASGFEKGSQVLVSTADETSCYASHVEIVFRDQYLARADMWRLVSAELANRCIFRGQRIVFMDSIKASIRTIFVNGRKVPSAFFHASTKPIFRSESARYVLFIQMSKEMWDFDADGTGEIMFDKVINGFLPELFKRWQQLKVKHLVSIVLFTRMVYEDRPTTSSTRGNISQERPSKRDRADDNNTRDFYRVVASDMASGEWADILNQLKREFRVFLRDISIRKPDVGDHLPLGTDISSALANLPSHVIAGRPSAATHGNVLEAINLASSQFSSDYIDRDLVRTGVSIVVVTPSAGLFEVDYDLLVATTDNLTDNGVGIDLVCLSKMPLHSVPLFKYRQPRSEVGDLINGRTSHVTEDQDTPTGSFSGGGYQKTTPMSSVTHERPRHVKEALAGLTGRQWSYGIPHWVDISFWTASLDEDRKATVAPFKAKPKSSFDAPRHKTFVPRVKMYELQMMGVMENAISDILVPSLSQTVWPSVSQSRSLSSASMFGSPRPASVRPTSEIFGSQSDGSGDRTPKLSTSIVSGRSGNRKSIGPLFQWMDEYDDLLFRHPLVAKKRARKAVPTRNISTGNGRYSPSLLGTSIGTRQGSITKSKHSSDEESFRSKATLERHALRERSSQKKNVANAESSKQKARTTPNTTPRQISFGPQGFGFARAKAIATTTTEQSADYKALATTTTEESADYKAPKSSTSQGFKSAFSIKHTTPSTKLTKKAHISTTSAGGSNPHEAILKDQDLRQSSDSELQQTSRPIPIRKTTAIRVSGGGRSKSTGARQLLDHEAAAQPIDRLQALQDLREEDYTASASDSERIDDLPTLPAILSPSTTLAPWLTMLNPSNPSKTKRAVASRLGRWQHIFPRPLPTSQIKWKSLCSPAAVPLTTEEFPSAEQLSEEYQERVYEVELPEKVDLSETPRSLIGEMLGLRISRGFQIVVGPRVTDSTKAPALQSLNIFDGQVLAEIGAVIFLSRGSIIQKLTRSDENKVKVTQLVRHGTITAKPNEAESIMYRPAICSTLADSYDIQEIPIVPPRGIFDWKMIDSFILGHERPQARDFVENLRPWRARFVLIPVDPPSNSRRPLRPMNEDNEEEIRLEGIRKLSQVWQKFRYIPPEERHFQMQLRNRKDTNPLDILYQTRNSSAIVAAELENVAEGDAAGRPVQLLPESDLYQRSNLNIASLAETIQTEKGVRMLDRRWHLRLHYNCFIGFELTTWLLQNFKDVDTRDEAVELGNELMKSGMFQHVEQRHNFRDGNYFYQIADQYRTPRPESRGWFGRGKASVPSTPMSEDAPKEFPTTSRSRASSTSISKSDADPGTPIGKKKNLRVALSKSLLYDVDHRKRSYRPELINLHYDRLHNPDNCYHIRVEWMNTTPKLIQDAVISWATSVDRFGLRLVEVPLGEACSISSMHPFRAPYLVKLAQQPPSKQPQSFFVDTTTFSSQPRPEKHFYQIAVMKRFSFVLDFEAASDFPADVDVTYSWGKPDYRYPQYIHRSGTVIAQITDDGDFLLLANRLYNNRNASNSSYHDAANLEKLGDPRQDRGMSFFRASPHRGNHRPSPRSSPYNSPSLRATLDIPSAGIAANNDSTPTVAPTNPTGFTRSGAATAFTTAEAIKKDFESFCMDVDVLETFYTEILRKASASVPSTPSMGAKTPSKGPETPFNESSIPTLALPGSLMSKDKKVEKGEKRPEMRTRIIGEESNGGGGTASGTPG